MDTYIQPTMRLGEEEKRVKRAALASTTVPWFLGRLTRCAHCVAGPSLPAVNRSSV